MPAELTIVGTVQKVGVRVWNEKRTPFLVIDVTDKPEYPTSVAVEFYGKSASAVDGVAAGATVEIEARVSSRAAASGDRYFTTVNGWKCKVIGEAAQTAPQATDPAATGARDEAIPF